MMWMASRRRALAGALSAILLSTDGRCLPPTNTQTVTRFRRGVAIHGAFNWPAMTADDTYAVIPFPGATTLLTGARLTTLRSTGFDFVRLSVNPRIFIALFGTPRYAEVEAALQDGVSRILKAGMNVIVDLHSVSRDPEEPRDALISDAGGHNAARVGALIERFAAWLGRVPNGRVALELWNEPDFSDGNAGAWDRLQTAWHARARRAAPQLTLVVAGLHTGYAGLQALDACNTNDGNTIFAFHYYDPTPFTLQGEVVTKGSIDPLRFFTHVPYPASADDVAATVAGARQRLNAASELSLSNRESIDAALQSRIRYLTQRDNRDWTEAKFDEVLAWAEHSGISPSRIMLGEFGVMRPGVDPAARYRWLADVAQAAEKRGFSWSLWAYDRAAMVGLVTDDATGALDRGMLHALGLKAG
jgi:endoglucanase